MTYNTKRRFSAQNNRPSYPRRNNNRNKRRTAQSINPALFVNKKIVTVTPDVYVADHMFTDFDLVEPLQENLNRAGFKAPSAIQDKTIALALEGKDVIGLANTGTGKTAAFLLPIINRLAREPLRNSTLVIAPTRELAQQIDTEFMKFSRGMKLYSTLCVGGVNISGQIRQLQRNPHIIIGTPGRIMDLIDRNVLHLDAIDSFVLDEADRMLDMGFVNDIRSIASLTPDTKQTFCFSATMSEGVKKITHDFMKDPEFISVKINETSDHIYQDVVAFSDEEHKKELLVNMLSDEKFEKVIIFGETKFGVQRLSDKLLKTGIASEAIHGNKSQGQRSRALSSFSKNQVKVLVATDVAARGLDIPNVSHVINFDLPQSYDDYVHRIGRTGRGGKNGTAFTFVKSR